MKNPEACICEKSLTIRHITTDCRGRIAGDRYTCECRACRMVQHAGHSMSGMMMDDGSEKRMIVDVHADMNDSFLNSIVKISVGFSNNPIMRALSRVWNGKSWGNIRFDRADGNESFEISQKRDVSRSGLFYDGHNSAIKSMHLSITNDFKDHIEFERLNAEMSIGVMDFALSFEDFNDAHNFTRLYFNKIIRLLSKNNVGEVIK